MQLPDDVVDHVQRHFRIPAATTFLVMPSLLVRRVLGLNFCRVTEHHIGQSNRRLCGIDRPVESIFDELGDKAKMVDMSVRDEQRIK